MPILKTVLSRAEACLRARLIIQPSHLRRKNPETGCMNLLFACELLWLHLLHVIIVVDFLLLVLIGFGNQRRYHPRAFGCHPPLRQVGKEANLK